MTKGHPSRSRPAPCMPTYRAAYSRVTSCGSVIASQLWTTGYALRMVKCACTHMHTWRNTMSDIMLESIYRAIGERIAKRRQEWSITQSALSQKTHLPIGRIEMGLDTPSITALYSIAHALCCPVAWLLPESENEEQV